jgi:predicted metal-dependent HD superfamily phosphohydrolase
MINEPKGRWLELCKKIPLTKNPEQVFSWIDKAYSEKWRKYHTFSHIERCLDLLAKHFWGTPDFYRMEMALWMHDVIMNPLAETNEELSAAFASTLIRDKNDADIVKECILGTAKDNRPEMLTAQYIRDLDFMILASDDETFRAYDKQIREEFSFLPPEVYQAGRIGFLSAMLKIPAIFSSPFFHKLCEAQAKNNLNSLLIELI